MDANKLQSVYYTQDAFTQDTPSHHTEENLHKIKDDSLVSQANRAILI